MILPMRHITLICVSHEQEQALKQLREFGGVHIHLKTNESKQFVASEQQLKNAVVALRTLKDAQRSTSLNPSGGQGNTLPDYQALISQVEQSLATTNIADIASQINQINQLAELRQQLVNEIFRVDNNIKLYQHFGNFDLEQFKQLVEQGFALQLFRAPENHTIQRDDQVQLLTILSHERGMVYGVQSGGKLDPLCDSIALPTITLTEMQTCHQQFQHYVGKINNYLQTLEHKQEAIEQEIRQRIANREFAAVTEAMSSQAQLAWITGWLPAEQEAAFRKCANQAKWGLLLRDPKIDELPPTLLRPPRIFKPVIALFNALGIAPAYNESDVSVIFFCFFSIFFAMLVGDGAYGALILGLTLWARKKMPQIPPEPFMLMRVFAVATIIWGLLSNTWLGTHPTLLDNPVSRWLGDIDHGINNTMLLCFTIGVIHLTLARGWSAIQLFPDTKFLAEVGWMGVVLFMYCLTCQIIGIFPAPSFIYPIFGVSLLLIFLFTLKRSELRSEGIQLGMLPLNIVGVLGDIISYVRLFAVSLASVKVAENFNEMAINLGLPLWAKIVPMLLILILGHGLNFLMAGLSILVHAVRLNTLEFSNHKGISWSGYAFKPFSIDKEIGS